MNERQDAGLNKAARDFMNLDVTAVASAHQAADGTVLTTSQIYILISQVPDAATVTAINWAIVTGDQANLRDCTWANEAVIRASAPFIPSTATRANQNDGIGAATPEVIPLDVNTFTTGNLGGRAIRSARSFQRNAPSTVGQSRDYILYLEANDLGSTPEGVKKLGCGLVRPYNKAAFLRDLEFLMAPAGYTIDTADQALIDAIDNNQDNTTVPGTI